MKSLLVLLMLTTACRVSVSGELEPGTYVCTARAPGFEDLEPHRLNSETADARAVFSYDGTGLTFTTDKGERVTLMPADSADWWCEKETP